MKRLRVVITRRAKSDIQLIRKYIAARSPENAASFVNRLEREVLSLSDYGAGAGLAPESHAFQFQLRQIVVWPYRVLFRVHRGRIEVLHVRHGARLPSKPDSRGRPE